MATQFASTSPHSFAIPARAPRSPLPAGRATAAVSKAIAALAPELLAPAADRFSSTDLPVDDLLKAAVELSPAMHHAFLVWLSTSIAYETTDMENAAEEALFRQVNRAHKILASSPAVTEADVWLKIFLRELNEQNDGSLIGPLAYEADEASDALVGRCLSKGIIEALPSYFPLAKPMATLGARVMARDGSAAGTLASAAAETKLSAEQIWNTARLRAELAEAAVKDCPPEPEDVFSAICSEMAHEQTVLLTTPAPTLADLAYKQKLYFRIDAHEFDEPLIGASITADLERLCPDALALSAENSAIVMAFEKYRAAFRVMKDDADACMSKDFEDRLFAIMDPADDVLHVEQALTPAGVAMKLRRAFVGLTGDAWSDFAVFDERPAVFADGLRVADMYTQMFWRAIEDLERMSGADRRQVAA